MLVASSMPRAVSTRASTGKRPPSSGRWRAAYTQLCAQDRATLGRDRFRASVAPVADHLREAAVQVLDPIGETRPASITLTLDDGSTLELAAEARHEPDGWKVCRLFG